MPIANVNDCLWYRSCTALPPGE